MAELVERRLYTDWIIRSTSCIPLPCRDWAEGCAAAGASMAVIIRLRGRNVVNTISATTSSTITSTRPIISEKIHSPRLAREK